MSSGSGVPAVPGVLSSAQQVDEFLALWRRVLAWDAADGLSPLSGPHTVLVVTDGGLCRIRPCDVSDPFMVDQQLQRTLLRRHVITESVPPADSRFAADGRAATLAGEQVKLTKLGDDPAFCLGDSPPAVASRPPLQEGDVTVYIVETPFVSCSEVSDAIGRHPQSNPFCPPGPPEPPVPEPKQ
ncbi:uncharacterized protein LOC122386065 [Amphibalanus amphitrite]|uniref:uncharacterized protein LOC122386065 n=1 Tax=Amphibalanus amphitrite TaxID=1232801 RepID=UPI001C90D593|nr:uncharacterized protein LOC122386065 [Amphibalanus amphitrite]